VADSIHTADGRMLLIIHERDMGMKLPRPATPADLAEACGCGGLRAENAAALLIVHGELARLRSRAEALRAQYCRGDETLHQCLARVHEERADYQYRYIGEVKDCGALSGEVERLRTESSQLRNELQLERLTTERLQRVAEAAHGWANAERGSGHEQDAERELHLALYDLDQRKPDPAADVAREGKRCGNCERWWPYDVRCQLGMKHGENWHCADYKRRAKEGG